MMSTIKPWAKKAFELIFHAEHHWRRGQDYDKRLALISFDNSIEVSISIYLRLNPIQRGNRHYPKKDVENWLRNYHSKLDFLSLEINNRKLPEKRDKAHITWLHEQRNELYHGSSGSVPELQTLEEIRFVALWVYSVLFDDSDIENHLNETIALIDKDEPVIPATFAKPTIEDLSDFASNPEKASTLLAASLLGKWDESNQGDMKIIRRLMDEL